MHVYAGLALPVLLIGLGVVAGAAGGLRPAQPVHPDDWSLAAVPDRRSGRIPVGKFNAGQKLNASFTVGAILVMLMTGSIMHWTGWFPLTWRTGATFVHDWLAFFVTSC